MKGLTKRSFRAAVKRLALLDPDLGGVFREHGFPELVPREPGFATLVMLIIEQQVSLSSARATFSRLVDAAGGELTPGRFVELDDERLRAIGFSRQKARYARLLAEAILSGSFDPAALASMSDDEARRVLRSLTRDRTLDCGGLSAHGHAEAGCLAGGRPRARGGCPGSKATRGRSDDRRARGDG